MSGFPALPPSQTNAIFNASDFVNVSAPVTLSELNNIFLTPTITVPVTSTSSIEANSLKALTTVNGQYIQSINTSTPYTVINGGGFQQSILNPLASTQTLASGFSPGTYYGPRTVGFVEPQDAVLYYNNSPGATADNGFCIQNISTANNVGSCRFSSTSILANVSIISQDPDTLSSIALNTSPNTPSIGLYPPSNALDYGTGANVTVRTGNSQTQTSAGLVVNTLNNVTQALFGTTNLDGQGHGYPTCSLLDNSNNTQTIIQPTLVEVILNNTLQSGLINNIVYGGIIQLSQTPTLPSVATSTAGQMVFVGTHLYIFISGAWVLIV